MRLLVNLVVVAATVAVAYARPQAEKSEEGFETLPNGCPVSWDIHRLLPHESDCRLFYYCVRGEKVLRECTNPNTHFNPVEQVCDWIEAAGCQLGGGGGGDESEEYEGSGDPDFSGSDEESDILPNGCPADFDVHKLLPHETECNQFYYCVFGEKVQRECAPGTYFNYDIQVCDWPENVDCANSGGGGGAGGEIGPATEGPGVDSDENQGGEWLDNGCPADFDVHKLLPHENDCALFYYCVHGNKVLRECSPGTHFNPSLQVCDWPENAGCGSSGGNTDSPENGSGEDNNVTDDPGNGSGEDNNVTEGPGNGSGEDNNVTDGPGHGSGETPGAGSGEWLENGCPADWSIHHLLPHETDCSLFYYCVHGNLVVRECAPGTHFNPVLQKCDWPHNAGCINGGGNTDSPGNGSEEDNIVTEAPGNESEEVTDSPGNNSGENNGEVTEGPSTEGPGNGSEENPGNGSEEDPSSPQDLICANDCHVGHWAHETDCDKFWKCKDGKAVLGVCSEGLHFNSEEQTCDFICNVNCVRDNIQATAGTDGLKLFVPWDKIDDKLLAAYRLLGI